MSTVTLNFSNPINVSLQEKPTNVASTTSADDIGAWDIIYYLNSSGNIVKLGKCIAKTNTSISVDVDNVTTRPNNGDYVFFGKDTTAGTSGIAGYYAEIEFKNISTVKAELFSVASEYFISSK